MRVFISKALHADFPTQALEDKFVRYFKAWKNSDDPCSRPMFGKNVTTSVPAGHDFDHLWHVHLLPEDEDSRVLWWDRFMSKTSNVRCNRQSDSLLYYAEYRGNFLLLRRTSHDLMRPPKEKLEAVCRVADRWVAQLKS